MPSKEKMPVRRFYEEIINNAGFDELGEILDPKIVRHDPLLQTGEVRGLEGFRSTLEMLRSAFPALHIIVEDQNQEDEQVVTGFTIHGTHKDKLMSISATT
jgi:predicted ester cyclase